MTRTEADLETYDSQWCLQIWTSHEISSCRLLVLSAALVLSGEGLCLLIASVKASSEKAKANFTIVFDH